MSEEPSMSEELGIYLDLYLGFYQVYRPCSDVYLADQWNNLESEAGSLVSVAQTDALSDLMSGRELEMSEEENLELGIYRNFCQIYKLCSDGFLRRELDQLDDSAHTPVSGAQYDAIVHIIDNRERLKNE